MSYSYPDKESKFDIVIRYTCLIYLCFTGVCVIISFQIAMLFLLCLGLFGNVFNLILILGSKIIEKYFPKSDIPAEKDIVKIENINIEDRPLIFID